MNPRRDDPSAGGYAVRVRLDKNPPKPKPKPKPRTAPEPTQDDLDRHMRMQGREQQDAETIMRKRLKKGGKVKKRHPFAVKTGA